MLILFGILSWKESVVQNNVILIIFPSCPQLNQIGVDADLEKGGGMKSMVSFARFANFLAVTNLRLSKYECIAYESRVGP